MCFTRTKCISLEKNLKFNFLRRFIFRQKRRNSDDADARRGVRRSERSDRSDVVVGRENKFSGAQSRTRKTSQRKAKPGEHLISS
jgi:hypothetical protein